MQPEPPPPSPNSRTGKFLVSCGAIYDGQICFWNWASKSLLARERTQVDVRSVSFSEDGGSVISAGKGHLRVWSVSQVGGGGARAGRAGGSQATVTLTGRSPVLGAYKVGTAPPLGLLPAPSRTPNPHGARTLANPDLRARLP